MRPRASSCPPAIAVAASCAITAARAPAATSTIDLSQAFGTAGALGARCSVSAVAPQRIRQMPELTGAPASVSGRHRVRHRARGVRGGTEDDERPGRRRAAV